MSWVPGVLSIQVGISPARARHWPAHWARMRPRTISVARGSGLMTGKSQAAATARLLVHPGSAGVGVGDFGAPAAYQVAASPPLHV